jgi:hypothetical protein
MRAIVHTTAFKGHHPYCPAICASLKHNVPQLPRRRSGALAELAASRRQLELGSLGGTLPSPCAQTNGLVELPMARTAIERASSQIQHWERRLEFCRLHVETRLRPGTETCAKWTAFLSKLEAKLFALRMRRDVLIGLEEAAQLDALPFCVSYADETINPEVAERFAAAFAESERRLTSDSKSDTS